MSTQKSQNESNEWLTVDEAASLLRVHPQTIRRMVKRGDIAHHKSGYVIRIPRSALTPEGGPAAPGAKSHDAHAA